MDNIILIGYGGHAKSVADCIERQKKYHIVGYTDADKHTSPYNYLGTDEVLQHLYTQGIHYAAICIGYLGRGSAREKLYQSLKDIGYTLPVIIDPSAIISPSVEIGEGTFVGKRAVINVEAKVGKMVIVNTMALIEHECIVSDFAHVAVSAVLCGKVNVGEAAFIGANATVIQGKTIYTHQTVPAGVTIR